LSGQTAEAVLERARSGGVHYRVVGNRLRLSPKDRVTGELAELFRSYKPEIIKFLESSRYEAVFPDEPPGGEANIAETRFRVVQDGYVLLWSAVLNDLVAFYGTEADREKIPPGFVPYSLAELDKLFADESNEWSPESLRLLHHAKKQGAVVTGVRREPDSNNASV
jgi:hypothetical protein